MERCSKPRWGQSAPDPNILISKKMVLTEYGRERNGALLHRPDEVSKRAFRVNIREE